MGVNEYCYWDVRSKFDENVMIVYLVIFTILFGFIIRACWISCWILIKKSKSKSKSQYCMKFGMFFYLALWYIAYVTEYIFGIVILNKYDHDLSKMTSEQLTKNSAIFEFIDCFPAVFLMGSIFLVCSILYSETLDKCETMGLNITVNQKRFKKVLTYYQFFRLFEIIPTFVLLNLGLNQGGEKSIIIWSNIYLVFYICDFAFCNITLCIVMQIMRKTAEKLRQLSKGQKIKLRCHTIFLQFTVFVRFIFGFVFLFYNTLGMDFNQDNCKTESRTRSVLYILVGQIIMHCFPVAIILYLFSYNKKGKDKKTSINNVSDMDIESPLHDQP